MELIRNKQTASLIILVCLLSIVAVSTIETRKSRAIVATCQVLQQDLRDIALGRALDGVIAQSVLVENAKTQTEYVKRDALAQRPLASITKLMTARTVLQQKVPLEAQYTLTEIDTAPYGAIPGIVTGATFTIADLLRASLVSSSNDSAEALMYSTGTQSPDSFYEAMTKEARDNNWQSFTFSGATGLDVGERPTAWGSAKDVSSLYIKNITEFPEVFIFPQTALSITSSEGVRVELSPTNEAIKNLPLLVAGKTGYTLSAGGNLAVVWKHPFSSDSYISAVVLGSTFSGRFADITKLYTTVNTYLQYEQSLQAVCK